MQESQAGNNLPVPRTSIIGRELDIAETRELLLHQEGRLLTLTGTGGAGKTRLAIEIARSVAESFPDGVWLAELARIHDPFLVPKMAASALCGRDSEDSANLESLVAFLRSRALLLVLDNCEHVIEACAGLADALLSTCPQVRILATSREPLNITGEHQWPVNPLTVPYADQTSTVEQLGHNPAVKLFVERACAVAPSFRLAPENASAVAHLCARLGGLPLAIELAAARVRILSVGQVCQCLADCFDVAVGTSRSTPARHQTLKATLDWSYSLLTCDEQVAFRRLSTLAGEWGVEAAEAVLSSGGACRGAVLHFLARLVDKSLLVASDQGGLIHYGMLEPVREYGRRILAENREELRAAEAKVAAYCIDLAETTERDLRGRRQAEGLKRLDRELDNIRAVLRSALDRGDAALALRLSSALYWYFWLRGHLREGQRWLESALAQDSYAPSKVRAKALCAAGLVSSLLGEQEKGQMLGRQALALYQEARSDSGSAFTTLVLSNIAYKLGDFESARTLAEQSTAFALASGSHWQLAQAHAALGQAIFQRNGAAQAEAAQLHKQALKLFEELGDDWAIIWTKAKLTPHHANRTDVLSAGAIAKIQLYFERGDHSALAAALEYIAVHASLVDPEQQIRLLAAAATLRKSLLAPTPKAECEDVERCIASARTQLGEVRFADAWTTGIAMDIGQVVGSLLGRPAPNGGVKQGAEREAPRMLNQPDKPLQALTRREREVARLLAKGFTDHEIATQLTITEGTARIHVHNIMQKLDFHSRVQVAVWTLAQS